tara:strand:- start:310 stop:1086 length:777 start_codon:yes stop_codon:yes gene_type:complete
MIKIDNNKILPDIKKFLNIYKNRPIKNNHNGMKINHMFALYYLLKKIKPKYIIESGVLKGQGTWLIKKTLPESTIFSIDIDLNQRKYISKKVKYLNDDFKYFNEKITPNKTLAFFDDHTDHLERIKQCKFLNIKNIIFEDNYSLGEGDFNSLKLILNQKNFIHKIHFKSHLKTLIIFVIEILKKIFIQNYIFNIDKIVFRLRDRNNKKNDIQINHIKDIFIFPKILSLIKDKKFKQKLIKNYESELESYNSFTFIKLK